MWRRSAATAPTPSCSSASRSGARRISIPARLRQARRACRKTSWRPIGSIWARWSGRRSWATPRRISRRVNPTLPTSRRASSRTSSPGSPWTAWTCCARCCATAPSPTSLPEDIMAAYREYLGAVERASQLGNAAEDLTAGESHLADIPARLFEDQLAGFAVDRMDVLREVLRNGAEPDERAVAAAVIGYAPKKEEAIKDLQFAMQDAEPAVRANAVRAMMAIAVLAQKRPELGLRIEPTWMVGMREEELREQWQQGDRETAIEKATAPAPKVRRGK